MIGRKVISRFKSNLHKVETLRDQGSINGLKINIKHTMDNV